MHRARPHERVILQTLADIVEAVRTSPAEACLREWLRDKLKGELHASIFNERGADFACYYYGALHEYTPHYTMDVDIPCRFQNRRGEELFG